MAERLPGDDHLAPDGRVMEVLSEHLCQGWLEGYLLTGRHGLFNSYEAFIHIVDSMFNQHAKWLKERAKPWRVPIASLNYLLLESCVAPGPQRLLPPGSRVHRPRREQEGRNRAGVLPARRELPALGGRPLPPEPDYVNVVVAGKQPRAAWLTMAEALQHCALGIGMWEWAASDAGGEPDVVLACIGDVPTLETLAAAVDCCASTSRAARCAW